MHTVKLCTKFLHPISQSIHFINICKYSLCYSLKHTQPTVTCFRNCRFLSSHTNDNSNSIPPFEQKTGESKDVLLARLVYQSRKRGTLEIGLLLSSFASRYLKTLSDIQLKEYDILINKPSNDWDIYNWIIKSKPTPAEYETAVMKLLQEYAMNKEKEIRITQPNLYS